MGATHFITIVLSQNIQNAQFPHNFPTTKLMMISKRHSWIILEVLRSRRCSSWWLKIPFQSKTRLEYQSYYVSTDLFTCIKSRRNPQFQRHNIAVCLLWTLGNIVCVQLVGSDQLVGSEKLYFYKKSPSNRNAHKVITITAPSICLTHA